MGLAAIALALLVVLSFAVTAAGQAPPYAVFPPIHGKHVAKGAYVNPYNYYTSPPAPTGITDFGLYNYTSMGGPVIPYTIMTEQGPRLRQHNKPACLLQTGQEVRG
ncbi:MAG: hypothetical protein MGAcid_20060 [uncultured Acidilobus sp. MG]|nr:MAG: hypothetical protein MGAcid_20060 [uncultured Acidilobus sp. MG]